MQYIFKLIRWYKEEAVWFLKAQPIEIHVYEHNLKVKKSMITNSNKHVLFKNKNHRIFSPSENIPLLKLAKTACLIILQVQINLTFDEDCHWFKLNYKTYY